MNNIFEVSVTKPVENTYKYSLSKFIFGLCYLQGILISDFVANKLKIYNY